MQSGVVSLWTLLEACRDGSREEQQQAGAAAERAIREHEGGSGLTLVCEHSRLLVDGCPWSGGAACLAAPHDLLAALRDSGITSVGFAGDVTASSLVRWAEHIIAGNVQRLDSDGVRVQPLAAAEQVKSVQRSQTIAAQSDSRLRSVFLQHQLIAGLPSIRGVDPTTAKLVIQGIVDRLLQIAGGLEPLMLLQQDEELLQRSTTVAVRTLLFARQAGWPMERLTDLGVAGLLHDLGSIIDPDEPGQAAFRWLLERGDEDFWLRNALVARRWRELPQDNALSGGGPLAVVALVRLAVVAGGQSATSEQRIQDVVDCSAVPAELAELARAALS